MSACESMPQALHTEGSCSDACQSSPNSFSAALSSSMKTSRFSPVSSASMTFSLQMRGAPAESDGCATVTSTCPITGAWS